MTEFVINQDRNQIYPATEQSYFNIAESFHGKISLGYSLYIDKRYLGTYEQYNEALRELCNIHNYDGEFYGVDGYNDEQFTPEYDDVTFILNNLPQ